MFERCNLADHFPLRELGEALAHEIIKAKVGTARMELLNRIFIQSRIADQLDCRVELDACRRARRREIEAQIAPRA